MKVLHIKGLKEKLDKVLSTTSELQNVPVIIYYDGQERDHLAFGAKIVTNSHQAPYDGSGTIDNSIEEYDSALTIVDYMFPGDEELHDPITISDLMDVLNQKNINPDAEVLCHFEVKDLAVTAYDAEIVTASNGFSIANRSTVKSAIEKYGAALVISDTKLLVSAGKY